MRIHHVSVVVADVARALAFYVDVLGLEPDSSRPAMAFDGAWLKVDGQQIHLLQVPNPDPVSGRPAHAGRDRHLALTVVALTDCERRLAQAGIDYTRSSSGRSAIFCRDPDGNALELIQA
jgi:glyoxylase I family protein